MVPMDLNIGETRVWLWFRAKSTTLDQYGYGSYVLKDQSTGANSPIFYHKFCWVSQTGNPYFNPLYHMFLPKKQGVLGIYWRYPLLKGFRAGGLTARGPPILRVFPTISPVNVLILCFWRSIASGCCIFFFGEGLFLFGPLKCYPRKMFASSNLDQKNARENGTLKTTYQE